MFEEKVYFIGIDTFFSSKKNKDYFVVYVVLNHKPVTYFVTSETYNKIKLKKFKELSECTAIFETKIIGSRVSCTLVDIK